MVRLDFDVTKHTTNSLELTFERDQATFDEAVILPKT